jgi:hypothetical protein
MKNVHVLPTDKPSRLYIGDNQNFVFGFTQTSIQSRNDYFTNQHIYITSDEEIKEGDWCLDFMNDKIYVATKVVLHNLKSLEYEEYLKKIILTTDQDLIKDDVRAINDTFLEWFVKNPSCESVEVDSWSDDLDGYWLKKYKIIIPSEEPQQDLPKVGTKEFNDLASACFGGNPKQETLEEVAENYAEKWNDLENQFKLSSCFIAGAKWQQERYSEEAEISLKNKQNQLLDDAIVIHSTRTGEIKDKELFANTGIESTTDESGNTHYNFKAVMKDTLGKEFYESADKTIKVTKQETTSEVFYRISKEIDYPEFDILSFKIGVEWQQQNSYSAEEFLEFSEWVSDNDWVYLPSKGYWVNEEQEESEQKFTTKEVFEMFKNK